MPIKQQAFLTAALLGMLQQADGPGGVEDTPGLTGTLLSGISARLGNPIESLRCGTVPQHKALPQVTFTCAAFMLSAQRLPYSMSAACSRFRSLTLALHNHCLQGPILTWTIQSGLSDACYTAKQLLCPLPDQLKSRPASFYPCCFAVILTATLRQASWCICMRSFLAEVLLKAKDSRPNPFRDWCFGLIHMPPCLGRS